MYTVKEVSEKTGLPISTISLYCRSGKFPNAEKQESPVGMTFWLIPETDLEGLEKRGRGRPPKTENK